MFCLTVYLLNFLYTKVDLIFKLMFYYHAFSYLIFLAVFIFYFQETNFREPLHRFSSKKLNELGLRYYTPDVHKAAFALPLYIAEVCIEQKHF